MHTLVLLRHGESEWNKQNLFTGWTDVDLNDYGKGQAKMAGVLIREAGIEIDIAYTSFLKRAIRTLWIALDEMNLMWIPQYKTWRLNERHYGALQGLNKSETAEQYGEEQVKLWRRSYDLQPPALGEGDERSPLRETRYKNIKECYLLQTESLKDTYDRVIPYWKEEIAPHVQVGETVLIAAHGNTLRALVKYLDELTNEQVIELNIPVGEPLVYELDDSLKPIRHYYLSSPERIALEVQQQIDMGKAEK